jgi:3-isopropylmalate/(R)-2-methylmalate dehydratase small subunit
MTVTGRAVAVRGEDIDTDRIMPARFLRAVSFDGLEAHVFEDDRRAGAAAGARHPFDDPARAGASVLLVNRNFGCGSSREHAPQALARWGIRAIVGESFAEIFFSNATALGVPCVSVAPEAASALMALAERDPAGTVTVDLERMAVRSGLIEAGCAMPQAARNAFLSGTWDATALLTADFAAVRRAAARLPYIAGFPPARA